MNSVKAIVELKCFRNMVKTEEVTTSNPESLFWNWAFYRQPERFPKRYKDVYITTWLLHIHYTCQWTYSTLTHKSNKMVLFKYHHLRSSRRQQPTSKRWLDLALRSTHCHGDSRPRCPDANACPETEIRPTPDSSMWPHWQIRSYQDRLEHTSSKHRYRKRGPK